MQTVTPISPATAAGATSAPQAGADDGAFPATLRRALPPADGNTLPPAGGNLPPAEAPAGTATNGEPPTAATADGLPVDGAAAPDLTGPTPPAAATPNAVPPVLEALQDIAAGRSAASGADPTLAVGTDAQSDAEAAHDESATAAQTSGGTAGVPPAADRAPAPLPAAPVAANPLGQHGANAIPAEATQHARAPAAEPDQGMVAGNPAAGRAARLSAKVPAGAGARPDAPAAPRVAAGADSPSASQAGTAQQLPAGTAPTSPPPDLGALGASAPLAPGGNATPSAAGAGVPAPMELHIAAPPGSPQFGAELGERLLWLVRDGLHEARLQLNPRELGPIEVRLSIGDGAAQASFSTQHAGTAAAVQQSLPQLRELLAQQGLQLGQATVSHQPGGDAAAGQQQTQTASGQAGWSGGHATDDDGPAARPTRVIGHGLVDAYA